MQQSNLRATGISEARSEAGSLDFLELAEAYARDKHRGHAFEFIRGEYIEHPVAVAQAMPTAYAKALAFLHDVVEENAEEKLGKTPKPASEESHIRREFLNMAAFFYRHGFSRDSLIEHNRTVEHLLQDLNALTRRRSRYPDETRHEAYMHYLKDAADHAERVRRPELLWVKAVDIKQNALPERNVAYSDADLSAEAAKTRARLARYEAGAVYVEERTVSLERNLELLRQQRSRRHHPQRPARQGGPGRKADGLGAANNNALARAPQ
ncbi:MAG: hypothetical protein M3N08_08305 [Pseudomonadota bacterium]|nr:hypothetical protein [Pseudomonadota bacterium]